MKRLLAYLLLMVLSFPILSGLLLAKLELNNYRATAISRFLASNNPMDLVEFTPNQLKNASWIDEREFIFQGQYYDVIQVKLQDSTSIILAWEDDQESKAKQKIKALQLTLWNDSPDTQKRILQFENFLKSLYFHSQLSHSHVLNTRKQLNFATVQSRIIHRFQKVPTPPPMIA